jgi:hypothetical protein
MSSSVCLDKHDLPAFLFEFIHGAEILYDRMSNNLFAPGEVCLSLPLIFIPSISWNWQRGRQKGNRGEVRIKEGFEKNLRVRVRNVPIIQCMCDDDWAFDALWQSGSIDVFPLRRKDQPGRPSKCQIGESSNEALDLQELSVPS